VIRIDTQRCSGCGACLKVCPTGALYLVDGEAAVDKALCNTCQECLAACPTGAIALAPQAEPAREPAPRPKPLSRWEPAMIRVKTQPLSLRTRLLPVAGAALPVAGAALAWAARQIMPQLVDLVLDRLDRRTGAPMAMVARATQMTRRRAAPGRELRAGGPKASDRQHRHRQQQRQRQRGRGHR
jgi:NAD-dependent dihydropyrimidine dehydrogenase PreA subunit